MLNEPCPEEEGVITTCRSAFQNIRGIFPEISSRMFELDFMTNTCSPPPVCGIRLVPIIWALPWGTSNAPPSYRNTQATFTMSMKTIMIGFEHNVLVVEFGYVFYDNMQYCLYMSGMFIRYDGGGETL